MLDPFDDIRLRELLLFERLAQLGTITAAARDLGVPKPTASRWLVLLEQRVGAALVLRGPRQATLTERGRVFHKQLRPLLSAARALRASADDNGPGGTLRVSVPVPFGRLVGGAVIARFRQRMPRVRLEVLFQNGRVDLLRNRIDLAIRGGALSDSSLIVRHLAKVPMWLYAAARFVGTDPAQLPLIAAPGDEALLATRLPTMLPAAVVVDDRTAVRDALREGAGAGVLPAFLGEPARDEGSLIRLDEQPLSLTPVHALFLPEQRHDVRLRALIQLIEDALVAGPNGGSGWLFHFMSHSSATDKK
ncbi:MAG TPA: LysR family transcriptional regulator [Sorangium sp.]|nr:LysR family transcriptional regulator [Sorangium sp.]